MDVRKNAHRNAYGYVIEVKEDGVDRYTYSKKRKDGKGIDDVLDYIEEKKLIILDEDSGKNKEYGWYDVIHPDILKDNVNLETMLSSISKELADEIDRDILNQLTSICEVQKKQKEEEEKAQENYKKFVRICKQHPWSINDENIPSYENWRMGNK